MYESLNPLSSEAELTVAQNKYNNDIQLTMSTAFYKKDQDIYYQCVSKECTVINNELLNINNNKLFSSLQYSNIYMDDTNLSLSGTEKLYTKINLYSS